MTSFSVLAPSLARRVGIDVRSPSVHVGRMVQSKRTSGTVPAEQRVDATTVFRRDDQSAALNRLKETRDEAAYEDLYRYYAPRLRSFMRRRGLEERQSHELAQDVMGRVWEKTDLYDPLKASASTWIFSLARNMLIDAVRKRRRAEVDMTDPMLVPDSPPAPDAGLTARDRTSALRSAIATLPEDQATVLTRIYLDGMRQIDVAEQLNIPLNTVKSRVRLAIGKLRASMEAF